MDISKIGFDLEHQDIYVFKYLFNNQLIISLSNGKSICKNA